MSALWAQTFTAGNQMTFYFNENGALVHPDGESPVTVGAFRAYFRLTNMMGGDGTITSTITTNLDGLQGVEEITNDELRITTKVIRNGMLFIERNGKTYNAQGAIVK